MAGLMEFALALVAVALPSMRVWLRRLIATPQGSGVEASRMSRLSRITSREQEGRARAEVVPKREVVSAAMEDKIRYGWEYSCEVTAGDQRENRRTTYPGWPVRWSDSVGEYMERRSEMTI